MRLRVTNAKTKRGRYYAAGEIIEDPSSTEQSYGRLYKWEVVPDAPVNLRSLSKPELVEIADSRGLDVSGLRKAEVVEALEA